eukprot:11223670-Lingulodinium_polyedra.AAC.1
MLTHFVRRNPGNSGLALVPTAADLAESPGATPGPAKTGTLHRSRKSCGLTTSARGARVTPRLDNAVSL